MKIGKIVVFAVVILAVLLVCKKCTCGKDKTTNATQTETKQSNN